MLSFAFPINVKPPTSITKQLNFRSKANINIIPDLCPPCFLRCPSNGGDNKRNYRYIKMERSKLDFVLRLKGRNSFGLNFNYLMLFVMY